MATTIKDIAARIGISHSTVSRALSGHPHVNEELRRFIQETAQAMNYRPNVVARRLKDRRTQLVGLLIPDLLTDFYARAATMIQAALARAGYRMLLSFSGNDADTEAAYLRTMREERVDGLIWAPLACSEPAIQEFADAGVPVIQFGRMVSADLDAVLPDDAEGVRAGTAHLVEHGHTRIALLVGQMSLSSGQTRLDGYVRAVSEAGLPVDENLVKAGRFDREWGRRATERLLDLADPPTAIMAASTVLAVGALQVLHDRGVRVPEQMSFVALGDPEWYSLWRPPITAVAFPTREMSVAVASRLLGRIHAAGSGRGGKPLQKRLGMRLIPRGSVAHLR